MEGLAHLIEALTWPALTLFALILFSKNIYSLIDAIKIRIEKGSAINTPFGSLGSAPSEIKAPDKNEPITNNNMALTHSSWRYQKKDKEFRHTMYCIHVIIQAPNEVLDRIEYVKYHLHPSYPNPVQTITNRESHFKLKELAYGESNIEADVKVKNQDELIKLVRYINLTETGPKIP